MVTAEPLERGTGRYPRLPAEEKRRRAKERDQRRRVEAKAHGTTSKRRTAVRDRRQYDLARPAPQPTTRDASVRALLGSHRKPGARMAASGVFSGYGMLLPFGDEPGMAATPERERGR